MILTTFWQAGQRCKLVRMTSPGSYLLETVQPSGGYTIAWFPETMASQPGQDVAGLQMFSDQAATAVG